MSGNPILRTMTMAVSAALALTALAAPVSAADPATICKDGGWQTQQTADGQSFKNQGQCVAYVVRGGQLRGAPLAVAFSDLNGNHVYDTGDVLIAMLVDSSGDNTPNAGDTIFMGWYPKVFDPTDASDFGKWGVTEHGVTGTWGTPTSLSIDVWSDTGLFLWSVFDGENPRDFFNELPSTGPGTIFQDHHAPPYLDSIWVLPGSPSQPADDVNIFQWDYSNASFIDVVIYYVP